LLALGGAVVDQVESSKKIVSPRLSAPSVSQPVQNSCLGVGAIGRSADRSLLLEGG